MAREYTDYRNQVLEYLEQAYGKSSGLLPEVRIEDAWATESTPEQCVDDYASFMSWEKYNTYGSTISN